jgi:hypothetical protein
MGRFIAGSISALLLVAAGLFWWQGRASQEQPALTAKADPQPAEESLPEADANVFDEAPPMPPSATMRTREERRFDRYDRNRDNIITRNELMASRTKDFRKLDTDSNNVLTFEEWAAHTADRFGTADANHDGKLTRPEFAATAPAKGKKPVCKC